MQDMPKKCTESCNMLSKPNNMKKYHKVITVIGIGLAALFDCLFITSDLIKGLENWKWALSLEVMGIALLGAYFLRNYSRKIVKLNLYLHLTVLLAGFGLHISGFMRILESIPVSFIEGLTLSLLLYLYVFKPWQNKKLTFRRRELLNTQEEKLSRDKRRALAGIPNRYYGVFKK